jgi:hypothetical protein
MRILWNAGKYSNYQTTWGHIPDVGICIAIAVMMSVLTKKERAVILNELTQHSFSVVSKHPVLWEQDFFDIWLRLSVD